MTQAVQWSTAHVISNRKDLDDELARLRSKLNHPAFTGEARAGQRRALLLRICDVERKIAEQMSAKTKDAAQHTYDPLSPLT